MTTARFFLVALALSASIQAGAASAPTSPHAPESKVSEQIKREILQGGPILLPSKQDRYQVSGAITHIKQGYLLLKNGKHRIVISEKKIPPGQKIFPGKWVIARVSAHDLIQGRILRAKLFPAVK